MKSKVLAGLGLLGVSLTVLGVGCGDDGGTTGTSGTGGAGGEGGGGTGGQPVTSSVTATTSTGMMMGDGNDSFEQAEVLDLSQGFAEADADLADPMEDVDFYAFDGEANQQVIILITAHPDGTDGQSSDYIDPVITVYNEAKEQIAFNDDPFPRLSRQDSELMMYLPTAGKYFVKVEDYHHFDPASGDAAVTDPSYTITVAGFNPDVLVNEAEPNDAGMMSTAIPLTAGANGYGLMLPSGKLQSGTDVDVFKFTAPADLMTDSGARPLTWFTFAPGTKDGTGSTVVLGKVELIDALSGDVVAQTNVGSEQGDATSSILWDRELFAPVVPGTEYFLKVQRSNATAGANDFYFIQFYPDLDSNPTETAEATNNVVTTPEPLLLNADDPMLPRYFVEGNLPAGDVDHFTVDVPNGVSQVSWGCFGESRGSGVRGLKGSLHEGDGTLITGTESTESESNDPMTAGFGAFIDATPIPMGLTSLTLKVVAGSQDAAVKGDFYSCVVVFSNPQN
jgi:hypothetical protein